MQNLHKVLLLPLALLALQGFASALTIEIDQNSSLQIKDSSGTEIASLVSGTISEKISAENQQFRISFGKDLNGRKTIIIYPDPESPQSLSLSLLGQSVSMSPDSVLTVTVSEADDSSLFEAGVLGTITVNGNAVAPDSALAIQGGQVLATAPSSLLNDSPAPAVASTPGNSSSAENSNSAAASAPAPSSNPGNSSPDFANQFSQGLIVKDVTGTAIMAPAGTNVIDLLRQSTNVPKLRRGDVIPPGASLQTDFDGSLILAQSPGVTMEVMGNTNLQVNQTTYNPSTNQRSFKANLSKGGIINNLEGVDRNNTTYEIQTPLCVAAARGTAFSVFTSDSISVIVTENGDVVVEVSGGTFTTSNGEKTVVTFESSTGEIQTAQFDATSEEAQLIQRLIEAARSLNPPQNGGGGQRPRDDRAIRKTDGLGGSGAEDNQLYLDDEASRLRRGETGQSDLLPAVREFLGTFNPRLNPGAITPFLPNQ